MDSIRRINECRREIERALLIVANPKKSRSGDHARFTQRVRLKDTRKKREYEKKMLSLKDKLREAFNELFNQFLDRAIYDKIAYDLIKIFHLISSRYIVHKENLYYGIRCVVIPVIWEILDEQQLGCDASKRQQIKKYFLKMLLTVEIYQEDSNETLDTSSTSGTSSIDICSESQRCNNNVGHQVHKPSCFTLEVLDTLFNALAKQTKVINSADFSINAHIYHIMNITYVFEILKEYFDAMKLQLENDLQRGVLASCLLYDAVGKYEKDIRKCLEEFNLDCPMTIFREQLYNLYFQLITMKPLLKC